MLLGRGLCDELVTFPEESYRLWCTVVCDLETRRKSEAITRVGPQCHKEKKSVFMTLTAALIRHNGFLLDMYERVKQLETVASSVNCVLKLVQDV